MEKRQSKQRKAQIRSPGGDHIGGLLVWGGALAFAGLATAFAVHKGKRRDADETSSRRKEEDQTNQGLRFVLQISSLTFLCSPWILYCFLYVHI